MKKILLISLPILILIAAYFLFKRSNSTSQVEGLGGLDKQMNPDYKNEPLFDEKIHGRSFYEDQAGEIYKDEQFLSYEEIMRRVETGRMNLVWELWSLRRQCPTDYSPSQCNMLILAMIEKNFPPPGGPKLMSLFKNYAEYEKEAREIQLSQKDSVTPFDERYEMIKKKRREIFKDERDIELVFGLEESKVNFIQKSQKFIEDTKNKSGDERVKGYYKLREETYGKFHEGVKEREDKFDVYQTEVFLRNNDLAKLSESEKNGKLKEMEIRIFGKEAAAKIAKGREEIAAENQKVANYESKEKEFLSMNAGISEKEKQEKLKKLRVELLGEIGAELYTKQKEIEALYK